MGQAEGDRDERPGPGPEPFEVFYLREYPQVVGLLHGLLGSRLVAEELAQETFLVAYRDWDRISRLDNPRAWVRKVAINQRGSFLRAYLRQQTRERDAVAQDEEDGIKLADDHAEVWQAIRTLPPLQAQVIALHYYEDYSVAQVAAATRLREIVRHTGQPVAHGRTAVLRDEPQESPRSPAPSLPASGKVSAAAAGSGVAATPTSHWTDRKTTSAFHSQLPSGNAVDKLLGSIWRSKSLIAVAVLLGALLGYGWAAGQPTLYEGVARVALVAGSDSTSLPGEASYPSGELEGHLRRQAQLMSSSPVLEGAVKLSGNRISVETLRQRLEVEAAQDADVLTIRVLDSTARGAAQLANAIPAAYEQVVVRRSREVAAQLLRARSALQTRLAEAQTELARNPTDARLQAECRALTDQDGEVLRQLMALEGSRPVLAWERAAVPKQPISPSRGRAMVIGMLLGLLAAALLVWWRARRQGPMSRSSAPEQGATSHLT